MKENVTEVFGFGAALGHHLLTVEPVAVVQADPAHAMFNIVMGAIISGTIGAFCGALTNMAFTFIIKKIKGK